MAAPTLKVEIKGPDGARYQTQIMARLGAMPSHAWPILWKHVVRYWGEVVMTRQFKAEGAYLGQKWAAISPLYRARKVQANYFADIGKRTGAMSQAYTNFFAPTGIFEPNGKTVTFGADVFTTAAFVEVDGESFGLGGEEYSQWYNEARKLFGDGTKLPTQLEFELGKIAAMMYTMVMRTSAGSTREGEIRFDGQVSSSFLSELSSAPIDRYVDDLIRELGTVFN